MFQQTFARSSEIAGDPVRAGEAYAEAAYLNGRPEQALVQLNTLKKRSDVDYYARARIDARIAAITPTVLELRRAGRPRRGPGPALTPPVSSAVCRRSPVTHGHETVVYLRRPPAMPR